MAPLRTAGPVMFSRLAFTAAAFLSNLVSAAALTFPVAAPASTTNDLHNFDKYIAHHGREYESTEEYQRRLELFQQRVAEIEEHNSKPGRLWQASVNKFTDRTEAELAPLRGYRRIAKTGGGNGDEGGSRSSFLGKASRTFDFKDLPRNHNYLHLKAMNDVKDQRDCGSCWAFATATVLRAHSELYQRDRTFSVQQLVDCTPNPNQCGGTGGCSGATSELAFGYLDQAELFDENRFPYFGTSAHSRHDCGASGGQAQHDTSFLSVLTRSLNLNLGHHDRHEHGGKHRGGAAIGMRSWRKLPENEVQPLLLAVYELGPVAVSVFANPAWNQYSSGIMDVCGKDNIINHAVTLIGYGEDNNVKYWHIQNSWGPEWGEHGHVRLIRFDDEDEGAFCGLDKHPELGTGCLGGPSEVTVCGQCGILYDSVVPTFDLSADGLLARNGNRTV